jgi:hypothetical protein
MNALRKVGITILLVLGLSLPAAASAGAASLSLAPGEYFIDTGALTLEDTGGPIATGVDEGGVAVFSFDSISIPAGAEVFAEGSRPLELRSAGDFTLGGFIEASGFDAEIFTAGPNPGGPGGGAGGTGSPDTGVGQGGGGATSNVEGGGGGGGFGGHGAAGGGPGAGSGGSSYGDLEAVLQGGSGGSGGASGTTGGGGGGGAVKLTAASLLIPASGEVFAEGGNGAVGAGGASGGGSGGGILLHANTIAVAGLLSAAGGAGGAGGCCGDAGGGGGGRIVYQYGSLVSAGEASVSGGESGVITNGAPLGHGSLSPEATGAPGVITKSQGPSATTSAASAVGLTGATLNGTVNPHGHATTYQFQLGTSTGYGTTVPIAGSSSDSADHALSQVISGLAPATTYHYRIVATGFGFTVAGADMTFTTAAKCSGVKIAKGRVKVKNGKAPIKLSTVGACKGDLALFMKAPPKGKAKGHGKGKASASKKKGKGAKSIQIGSASFSLEAGQTQTIEVPLSAAALKRLSLGKALPATAKATATDGVDPKVTTHGNVSLKLAKKGKGPKKH